MLWSCVRVCVCVCDDEGRDDQRVLIGGPRKESKICICSAWSCRRFGPVLNSNCLLYSCKPSEEERNAEAGRLACLC